MFSHMHRILHSIHIELQNTCCPPPHVELDDWVLFVNYRVGEGKKPQPFLSLQWRLEDPRSKHDMQKVIVYMQYLIDFFTHGSRLL